MIERSVRVIVNPRSGHPPDERRLGEAIAWLQNAGWRVDRQTTLAGGHACELAAEAASSGAGAVLVCGGDGTINEAVNGLAGSETALAVLPCGTANIWARETGLGRTPMSAARLLEAGEVRRVDLGRAGERYFLLLASVGTDSMAIRQVSANAKRRWGKLAFIAAGLKDLFQHGGRRMTVDAAHSRIDDEVLVAVIGNTRLYGGAFIVTHGARLDDGLLDVCVYRGTNWWQLASHVARTVAQRHSRHPTVLYRQAARISISSDSTLPVEADGEYIGTTPMTFEAVPNALNVIVPRGLRSPLFSVTHG